MVVQHEINIQHSSINQKSNNAMSVMLCTRALFVKKNSCLVARIVSFNTVGLHLLIFCILQPYLFENTELNLSNVISYS